MDFWGKEDIATDARMDGQLKKTSFVALLYPKIIPRNARIHGIEKYVKLLNSKP